MVNIRYHHCAYASRASMAQRDNRSAAEFNMKIPKHLHEEAEKHSTAARLVAYVNTPIYNGRVVEDITLDSTGFSFGHAPTTMEGQDFYDIHTVHTKYFPEVIEHIKCLTGATAVLPFDHSVRNSTLMRDGTGIGGPVGFAHTTIRIGAGQTARGNC